MTEIRKVVRQHLAHASFPLATRAHVEDILVRAIRYYRLCLKRSRVRRAPMLRRTNILNPHHQRGPKNKKMARLYLQSQIYYAWLVGKQADPIINNMGYCQSPFISFAENILIGEKIFRNIKNWEEFRSYRKKELQKSGIRLVRGKPI